MSAEHNQEQDKLYSIELKDIDGQSYRLDQYKEHPLLIVNTASRCGFTPQYQGLQNLHDELHERGLRIVGFPCNQFGGQEPGDSEDIKNFCQLRYDVSFPMNEKIEVNGPNEHPLYKILKQQAPGVLGTTAIKWNFTKFLLSPGATKISRFSPRATPESLREHILELLDSN